MTSLELAVRFGKTLIIQEVDGVEPVLYPLLRRDLIAQGIDTHSHCQLPHDNFGIFSLKEYSLLINDILDIWPKGGGWDYTRLRLPYLFHPN